MARKEMIKGGYAVARAAISAGCRGYFGYPITPQSEIGEYMARYIFESGGVFVQAESEVAASAMLYGACASGVRAMTSSSGPGIALMQENISTMHMADCPAVIVNMMRGGPGGGSIETAQSDYFQVVKGGGTGDYANIVLTPNCVQELADFTVLAFELADKYRAPVFLLGDASLAQMMEEAVIPKPIEDLPLKLWAADGKRSEGIKRDRNAFFHVFTAEKCEQRNIALQAKYREIEKNEQRFEEILCDDADLIIVAYGIASRIAQETVDLAREKGLKVGLFRPQAVWPFPSDRLLQLAEHTKEFVSAELSCGQMIEDIQRFLAGKARVTLVGRCGGMLFSETDLLSKVTEILSKGDVKNG